MNTYTFESESDAYTFIQSEAARLARELTGYSSIDPSSAGDRSRELREEGRDWPGDPALTMIGLKRMANIHELTERIVFNHIPGDFMECGVWRGGAVIYMRKLLDMYQQRKRWVFVADSFAGFPETGLRKYPCDNIDFGSNDYIAVSYETVRNNFIEHFDDNAQRVEFLQGWFKDTLPTIHPSHRFALLRLDADLYESTIDCLNHLYSRVSPGGYVIVDDYGALVACKQAVDEFREREGITAPLIQIDWTGIYWQKPDRS